MSSVVIPATGPASGLACVRSLGRFGVNPLVATDRKITPESHSRYCAETVRITDPGENYTAFVSDLQTLAERDDVRTIFPLRESDIYALANNRKWLKTHVATPWVDSETLSQVQDRKRLLEHAESIGVPTPEWNLLSSDMYIEEPTVVKSRFSIMKDGNKLSYPGVEILDVGSTVDSDEITTQMNHQPLCQEYVPGTEYGFFAVVDDGMIKRTFQHRRIRSHSYLGGSSSFREAIANDRIDRLGKRLLSSLNWTGVAMVEFKHDPRTDRFKLMEINPRFWGSLPLAVAAGADFPVELFRVVEDQQPHSSLEYEVGTSCKRGFHELRYLLSLIAADPPSYVDKPSFLRGLWDVLVSSFDCEFDYLSRSDPWPAVYNIVDHVYRVF
jgi:predicted ATP-grasp superfamily ATP-dependent carboligase